MKKYREVYYIYLFYIKKNIFFFVGNNIKLSSLARSLIAIIQWRASNVTKTNEQYKNILYRHRRCEKIAKRLYKKIARQIKLCANKLKCEELNWRNIIFNYQKDVYALDGATRQKIVFVCVWSGHLRNWIDTDLINFSFLKIGTWPGPQNGYK